MRILFLLLATVFFAATGCKKVYPTTEIYHDTTVVVHADTTIIRDTTIIDGIKQLGFTFPTFNTSDTSFISGEYYSLKKFNIGYFPHADSVFYTGNIVLGDIDQVEFQLYDVTDNVPIEGSTITFTQSDANTSKYYQSGNFIKNLPHKEINIGFRMRSTKGGAFVGIADATLFVYMK